MESSPLRVIPLLSIRSPCRGILFDRLQGACEGMARPRDWGLEESRVVALVDDIYIYIYTCIEMSNFNICII